MVATISSTDAVGHAQTGDVWLFRGRSGADRAIRVFTNSPVNHVAMVVALDDLPPLLWHAELGQSSDSVWSGDRHRGAQLNRLDDALAVWTRKYHQLAFVRQFDGDVTPAMEDAVLRVVAEYEGRPFPRTPRLVGKWLSGRLRHEASEQAVYCAELLAITYARMGLLDARTPANWFDPGRFWSGDRLELLGGAALGGGDRGHALMLRRPDAYVVARAGHDRERMTGQVPFRFCTVASASHYPGLVALVNSLRLVGHREPVTVFDLGLTDRQRAEVGADCEVVAPDGDAVHPWLVMPQVLQAVPPGLTVYLDSDIIVTRSLDDIAERARAGDVCAFADRFAERRFQEWKDLFGLASAPRAQPYVNAGFMALDTARFPEFVQRWRVLCDAMVIRSISVAKLDVGDPLTWPDQDALNALLMSEVAPERVAVQPADDASQGPWELSTTRVVDVRTLACTRAEHPVKLLHAFGVPKPWQPEARRSLPRTAYLTCLRRLLTGDDVAIRTREPLARWLAPGVRGSAALHLETAVTALRARAKKVRKAAPRE